MDCCIILIVFFILFLAGLQIENVAVIEVEVEVEVETEAGVKGEGDIVPVSEVD